MTGTFFFLGSVKNKSGLKNISPVVKSRSRRGRSWGRSCYCDTGWPHCFPGWVRLVSMVGPKAEVCAWVCGCVYVCMSMHEYACVYVTCTCVYCISVCVNVHVCMYLYDCVLMCAHMSCMRVHCIISVFMCVLHGCAHGCV